jgi:hypothetical protein
MKEQPRIIDEQEEELYEHMRKMKNHIRNYLDTGNDGLFSYARKYDDQGDLLVCMVRAIGIWGGNGAEKRKALRNLLTAIESGQKDDAPEPRTN